MWELSPLLIIVGFKIGKKRHNVMIILKMDGCSITWGHRHASTKSIISTASCAFLLWIHTWGLNFELTWLPINRPFQNRFGNLQKSHVPDPTCHVEFSNQSCKSSSAQEFCKQITRWHIGSKLRIHNDLRLQIDLQWTSMGNGNERVPAM